MSLTVEALVLERLDGVPLLGPLDLSLAPGGRLGLVGESGSGKSLLVQALFGALPAGVRQTGGAVRTWGGAASQACGTRLGWMPQDPRQALNPLLNLAQHLTLLPRLHRRESIPAALVRLAPLLQRLDLPTEQAFLRRFPHQLSGGQRQRIALAMALSCEPELLVLDEPTTALDPLAQRDFLDLVLSLQQERGLGFLWITHDLALAAAACDRLLVLYGGEPLEAGPTPRLLSAPRHPYMARLLGAAHRQPSSEAGFLSVPEARTGGCPFRPRCPEAAEACADWGPWQGAPADGYRCERPLESGPRP
jgi:ABC-type dipeptide/oligopeptide/nickel transport system ATPase component